MSNQLITSENNERVKSFFLSLDRQYSSLEHLFSSRKPTLNGESFYIDEELSQILRQPDNTKIPLRSKFLTVKIFIF